MLHGHCLCLDLLLLLLKLVFLFELGTLLLFLEDRHHLGQLAHLLLFVLLVLLFLFAFGFLTSLHIIFEHLADLVLNKRAQIRSQPSLVHQHLNLLWLLPKALRLLFLGLVYLTRLVLARFLLLCLLLLFLLILLFLKAADEWSSPFERRVGPVFARHRLLFCWCLQFLLGGWHSKECLWNLRLMIANEAILQELLRQLLDRVVVVKLSLVHSLTACWNTLASHVVLGQLLESIEDPLRMILECHD